MNDSVPLNLAIRSRNIVNRFTADFNGHKIRPQDSIFPSETGIGDRVMAVAAFVYDFKCANQRICEQHVSFRESA
jgi:hypothetical protein